MWRDISEDRLQRIAVGDGAAEDVVRAAGNLGESRQQQSAGARLGSTDRQSAISQQRADDFFHRPSIYAEYVVFQRGHQRIASGAEARLRLGACRASQRQVQFHLPGHRQDGRFDRRILVRPSRVDRLGDLLDVRFAAARDESVSRYIRQPPVRPARNPPHSRSNIGFSSRGGPGSKTTTCSPCSIISPGAVPFGLSRTTAPAGTIACRLFTSGIRMPRRSNRARIWSTIEGSSDKGRSRALAITSRVRSSSVGPSPREHHEIRSRHRAEKNLAKPIAIVGNDALRPQLDAEVSQPAGEKQRVGVEPRHAEEFAARRR